MLTFTRYVSGYYAGPWIPPAYSSYRLSGGDVFTPGLTLTTDQDETEIYSAGGDLLSYADRAGRTLTFGYDEKGRLSSVTDPFGRRLTYFYNGNQPDSQISKVQAPDGSIYAFGYDSSLRLASVTDPNGSQRRYLYEIAGRNWLTGVVDENDARYASFSYTFGHATSSEHAGGADRYTVDYGLVNWGTARVWTPLGTPKQFTLTLIAGLAKQTGEWRACSDCSPNFANGQSDANTYDGHANLKSHTDFNGNKTTFDYDEARNLPTLQTLAAGTPLARTIRTRWHPDFRLPVEIFEDAPGTSNDRTSTFTYDAKGNLLTATVASGSSMSTRSYKYDVTGRFLTEATDPRGFVTRYAYDTVNGNLTSVTNALGHVTTYSDYDVHGRPKKITDPNNVETSLTYNFRGQITSRVTLGLTTRYTYDKVGELTKVEEPSGAVTNYGYDAAHRLTSVSDRFGNRTVYTLDPAGNRTKEETFAPGSNVAARTHRRDYDGFERLLRDIDASEHASLLSYDANDNNIRKTDANGDATSFDYDELNRLEKKTEPEGSALTRYAYDTLGRLASVTDPRNRVTSYTNNLLDRPTTISSPDTGVTTKTYDAAGNILTSRDARGQTTNYMHDRLIKTTLADGSTINYVYDEGDEGDYGKGRRTSMIDATGRTRWIYDAHGHVLRKTQITGAVTLTTQWSYDAKGRIESVIYPSGYKILYAYDVGGRVSAIGLQAPGQVSATTFIDQIAYSSFGPVASWRQAASNTFYRRSFDRDGRISGITPSTGYPLSYAYDHVGRLESITQNGAARTFSYDRNHRLTRYVNGATTILYGYDKSGNRIFDNAFNYTIAPTSNRIASRTPIGSSTPQTLFYDAAGGMENNGQFELRYDERNRLDRVTVGALTTTYGVNGLGERVAKDGQQAFGKVEHVYDLSGRVLGLYKSGAVVEEIVWLGDLPVGTLQGGAAYSIAPDHLGAPLQIVNSQNTRVWLWDHDPFGNGAPAAAAGFSHRLRFPGQVYDAETGLHSNGQRDYDPRLGRYVESDPTGLEGGINTYAYAGNDPVNMIDPLGLDGERGSDGFWSDFMNYLSNSWNSLARAPSDIRDNPGGVFRSGLEGLAAVGLPAARAAGVARAEIVTIKLSRKLHGEAAQHAADAIKAGKPDLLTVDRAGTAANRQAAMGELEKVPGKHLDEYPPAMFREGGAGASVRAIDPRDNMSAGACIGNACRGLPDGTQVRIVIGD